MLRNYVQVLFVTVMVGRISWDDTSPPLKFKIFCNIFMTCISFVKSVLASQDGALICTPKVTVSDCDFSHISGQKLGFSCASPKPVSIWLSLSATIVHELKPGSSYLSKTLRAVKSLKNVMTHLFLPGLEMWDPLVMPPHSSPCCHPGVLGAHTDLPRDQLQQQRACPTQEAPTWLRERKSQSGIPWKQGYSSRQLFPPVTMELQRIAAASCADEPETWGKDSLRKPIKSKVSPWAASCCHQPHKQGLRWVVVPGCSCKE